MPHATWWTWAAMDVPANGSDVSAAVSGVSVPKNPPLLAGVGEVAPALWRSLKGFSQHSCELTEHDVASTSGMVPFSSVDWIDTACKRPIE